MYADDVPKDLWYFEAVSRTEDYLAIVFGAFIFRKQGHSVYLTMP